MVVCPHCGEEFDLKLKCKRCGYEWYAKDPDKLPTVCPNPKCKSPYWNRERVLKRVPKEHDGSNGNGSNGKEGVGV